MCNSFTLFNIQIRIKRYIIQILPPISHLSAQFPCPPPKVNHYFQLLCIILCICLKQEMKIQILSSSCFSRQKLILQILLFTLPFHSSFFLQCRVSHFMDAYSVFIQSLLLIIIGLFPEWKFKSRMEKTDIPGIYSLHFPKNSLADCLLS